MVSISEMLNPEVVEQLEQMKSNAPDESVKEDTNNEIVKKDRLKLYKEMLEENPSLKEKIVETFSTAQNIPAIHITTESFKMGDKVISSGFIENITENGFRPKDTNIGVFMKREGFREPATPLDFVDKPEKFLRELETIIRHYYHHGIRTNKNILGQEYEGYVGIPVMLLVDVADKTLIPGSDYEDHYKLGESVSSERIIGKIDLEEIGSKIKEELPRIALEFTDKVAKYIQERSE